MPVRAKNIHAEIARLAPADDWQRMALPGHTAEKQKKNRRSSAEAGERRFSVIEKG